MSLPPPIIAVLAHFRPAFSAPTWRKASVSVVGTLLARGRRMVTTALRQMGYQDEPHFSHYHHGLNRARWSAFEVSRRWLDLLGSTFVAADGVIEVVIDGNRSGGEDKRRRGVAGPVSGEGLGEKRQERTRALATGGGHGQDALDKPQAALAVGAKRPFTPQDSRTHGAFSGIIGRLDARDGDECPQRPRQLEQFGAETAYLVPGPG